MGSMSRNKGRTAEREVELILQAAGLQTDRNIGGRRQVSGDIAARPGGPMWTEARGVRPDYSLAIEVRRRERLLIPAWAADHEQSCPPDAIPVLAWRANRMPWRATLKLDDLLTLIGTDAPTDEETR